MMFRLRLRRKEQPWEVVDRKAVEPVLMVCDDEDFDLLSVCGVNTRGTYVFDLKPRHSHYDMRKAVIFAQQQLLQEVEKKGYNVLLLEGWSLTLWRRGNHKRIEVEYSGRAARVNRKPYIQPRPPPFMALLHSPL